MTNMKYLKYIILAIICFSIGYYSAPKIFGARTFTYDYYNVENGGYVASSTSNAAVTLPFSIFDGNNYIDYTPNIDTTLTLPASSTMSTLIPDVGDNRTYLIRNASSTAVATITLAEGTGNDLQILEATGADLVVEGLDVAELKMIRKNDTNILYLFKEYTEQ